MPRITFPDFDNASGARTAEEPFPYLAMDVVYVPIPAKDSYWGSYWNREGQPDYYVMRADNRRILGTIERVCDKVGKPKKDTWAAWPCSEPFRGDHFDDDSHDAMDKVPDRYSRSPRAGWNPLDVTSTRDEAVEALLTHLYRHQAPAMGFGRCWGVERFENVLRKDVKVTRRLMTAGPYPTVPVKDEWGIVDHVVPTGAEPLRLDTPTAQPKLTKTQVRILKRALIDDDRVWSDRALGNITSLRRLHALGYIHDPEYGTRLTDTGRQLARRLLMKGEG